MKRISWITRSAILAFTVLALLPATAGWAQKKSSPEVRKALKKADRQILSYSPEKARQQLEPVMAENDPMVDAAMGQVLVLEKNYDEAVTKLEAAAKQVDDPMLLIALGDAQAYAKNKSEASSSYKKAAQEAEKRLEKKPSDTDARVALGIAQQRQKDYDEAVSNLTKAKSEDAGNPRIPFELGMTKMLQGDHQAAFDNLSAAIDGYSGYAYAYYYRALAANQIGRKDIAVNDLDRFLALAPDAPEAPKATRLLESLRG